MILYDTVCTPCARKTEWRELRNYARKHKLELARVDVKKQPQHLKDIWWDIKSIPLPALEYELEGERLAINLAEFLQITKENT